MLIVFCEDMPLDMERLMDLCDRYAEEKGYRFETACYAHSDALLADPDARRADIIMLDIMMPCEEGHRSAGVDTARRLRSEGYEGAIVFTSTSEDYYPEGFEVGAMHYLIKPLTYEAVVQALDRAISMIRAPERIITVPVNRIQVSVPLCQIQYAEVYGRETILHTNGDTLRVLLPLKSIERMLEGGPFLRCYRSYIINMDCVASMEENCFVLLDGTRIPLTLRNRQALRERFFTYHLQNVNTSPPRF